jgi:hypothetical protein
MIKINNKVFLKFKKKNFFINENFLIKNIFLYFFFFRPLSETCVDPVECSLPYTHGEDGQEE